MLHWRGILTIIVGSVTFFLVASQVGTYFFGDLSADQRNSQLVRSLRVDIADNLRREGINVTVIDVRCEDLPDNSEVFTVTCDVDVEEIAESFQAIAQGSSTGDAVTVEEVFPRERLVTQEQAIAYVQRLVDSQVLDCDLGGPIAVLRQGNEFDCQTEFNEIVTITVAGNGSGSISRTQRMPGT